MSSIFTPDPVTLDFSTITTYPNLRYGPHLHHTLNYYRNSERLAGGNPVLFFTHGGALVSYDKSDQPINGRVSTWHIRFLLSTIWQTYGDVPFDVVSIEVPQWSHALSESADFEPQLDDPAITHGLGAVQYQPYGLGFYDDIQRAWQYVFHNASWLGCDPDRAVASGYSYGALGSMCAALRASRPWGGVGQYSREAKVSMVLNYSGEIDMSPEFNEHTTTRYIFGITGTDNTYSGAVRAQMNRLLLIPKSDGTFDSTCAKTPYAKAMSPMDLIEVATAAKRLCRFRSYYDTDDNTASPILGYPAVPPYDYSGHDYHQAALLHAKLGQYGFTSTIGTYDGTSIQAAIEPTLVATYTDMVEAVA